MSFELKSIAEQIDCLARLTGAPRSFVCQVKDLFSRKGISLESDASPYLRALEEAFKREEAIRTNAHRARANLARLADNFNRIGRSYVHQLEQLRKIQSELQGRSREVPHSGAAARSAGQRRAFMVPQVSDHLLMVPGPEDEQ